MDLAALLARVPEGWTEVTYGGRRWGLSRTTRAGGRAVAVYAEELGGPAYVSANVYLGARPTADAVLRPCEMPAADVLAFLAGWRRPSAHPEPSAWPPTSASPTAGERDRDVVDHPAWAEPVRGPAGETGPVGHRHVVVMGVSGSGKSTVGVALAERLGLPYADGDDLHPPANIAKMAAGHPLDDADRAPWLAAVGAWLADHPDGGVIACSALRRRYRDGIRAVAPDAFFVWLDAPHDVIARRQAHRPGHFMPAALLDSQFATLEPLQPDEPGIELSVDRPLPEVLDTYVDATG